MKRSVIQLAGRTLLVSLPAKWADANGVKKGDELEIVEDGHRLIVNTEAKSNIETAEFNADAVGDLLKRYIYALYKKGIDEIKINYSDSKTSDAIREIVLNETVGYEIVSQTPKTCIVKLITSGSITEFDNLLRRTFLLLISMAEEAEATIKNKDFGHLTNIALLEKPNNRLTTICRRSLNKWGTETYKKIGPIYYIVEELENIADEYKRLCNNLANLKNVTLRPEVLNTLNKTNASLRQFYEVFYKFDINKIDTLHNAREVLIKTAHELIEKNKLSPAEFYVVHHSIIILQEILCMIGPYLVLAN
jgi:phosphate uptake regulator